MEEDLNLLKEEIRKNNLVVNLLLEQTMQIQKIITYLLVNTDLKQPFVEDSLKDNEQDKEFISYLKETMPFNQVVDEDVSQQIGNNQMINRGILYQYGNKLNFLILSILQILEKQDFQPGFQQEMGKNLMILHHTLQGIVENIKNQSISPPQTKENKEILPGEQMQPGSNQEISNPSESKTSADKEIAKPLMSDNYFEYSDKFYLRKLYTVEYKTEHIGVLSSAIRAELPVHAKHSSAKNTAKVLLFVYLNHHATYEEMRKATGMSPGGFAKHFSMMRRKGWLNRRAYMQYELSGNGVAYIRQAFPFAFKDRF